MIRERGITLEVCPTSNLNTRVVSPAGTSSAGSSTRSASNRVKFTINTDGPEMLKTYIRDELATLGRLGILSRGGAGAGRRLGRGSVLRVRRGLRDRCPVAHSPQRASDRARRGLKSMHRVDCQRMAVVQAAWRPSTFSLIDHNAVRMRGLDRSCASAQRCRETQRDLRPSKCEKRSCDDRPTQFTSGSEATCRKQWSVAF